MRMLLSLAIDFSQVSSDAAFVSSVAIVLGAVFVVLQIRDNRKLILLKNGGSGRPRPCLLAS
jgi:hypothetical protein